jgi:predicted Zn-dependent protease
MSHDRIAQALELWRKFPDNDLSRYNLAQAHFDAGQLAEAAEHLQPLCAKKPDWMVVHILLGKCLLTAGQPAEARRFLEQARQLAVAQYHEGPLEELTELLKTL